MGIVNIRERLVALDRQKLLFENRCAGCPYRIKAGRRAIAKECKTCLVYNEFLEIGEVLNKTVRERAIWEYDDEVL